MVGIVADDLTGANDTAAQFATRGWSTLLSLRGGDSAAGLADAEVVAVTTGSRGRGSAARGLTRDAVATVAGTGVEHVYLKIDSTLRGPVTDQVAGALEAWSVRYRDAFAVVCPSYPAMGRSVQDGCVRADGVLLEDGHAGRDPGAPVATSAVSDLVRGSVRVPLGPDPATLARRLVERAAGHRVVAVDAATDAHLQLVAAAVGSVGPRALPVGSAGLAAALAGVWERPAARPAAVPGIPSGRGRPPVVPPGPGPTIVLTTSLHDAARRQTRRVVELHRDRVWVLAPRQSDLRDDVALASWLARQRVPHDRPDVVVVTAPLPEGPVDRFLVGVVAPRLAAVVDDVHGRTGARCLVVTGGDGAGALVDRWDCVGLRVGGFVREGVPHGVLVGGRADGLTVVTKAGGFGTPDALVDAVAWAAGRPPTGSRSAQHHHGSQRGP